MWLSWKSKRWAVSGKFLPMPKLLLDGTPLTRLVCADSGSVAVLGIKIIARHKRYYERSRQRLR